MTFAASINCIDGRVQLPITAYIKKKYEVDFVDLITIPGCDRVLSSASDEQALAAVRHHVDISIRKHKSQFVFVSGHDDCAANPVDMETHIKQIRQAMTLIDSWDFRVQVVGLWIDDRFQVHEIS